MNYHGIFAFDPGGHTGVAWAIVSLTHGSTEEALNNRVHDGSATIEGDEYSQIVNLFNMWVKFRESCDNFGIPPENVHLVAEDFSLLPGQHVGGKQGISPVRILWGFEGYRLGRYHAYRKRDKIMAPIRLQLPGDASNKRIPTERQKRWGIWIVGKDHERSAYRHLAIYVQKLLSGKVR